AVIFPTVPALPRTAAAKIIAAVIGNPIKNGLINPRAQTSSAFATTCGQRPLHNSHNPGNASRKPRITKKIAIVSAINMTQVLRECRQTAGVCSRFRNQMVAGGKPNRNVRSTLYPRGVSVENVLWKKKVRE